LETITHTRVALHEIASVGPVRREWIVHMHDDSGAIAFEDNPCEAAIGREASHVVKGTSFSS
jgi:hypothetical protein